MKKLKLYGNRLIIGAGSLSYVKEIENKRVMVITGGRSLFNNGTIKRLGAYLSEGNNKVEVFSGISKNPDTSIVELGVMAMKSFRPDIVIAIGGGSPIDAAKVMSLLYDVPSLNIENIRSSDIMEMKLSIPFIAVPTTSGTGTEVTKTAVITFKKENIKIGLKSEAFIPEIALLDAELTMTMPDNIVAETGMDAMTHGLECYINHNLDDYTECLTMGAIKGLFNYLPISYKEKTIKAREKVHHYQNIAGMAFHNVGLGMSHGISHAFGGQYDLGHGLLNGICLPYVLAFNRRNEIVDLKLKNIESVLNISDIVTAVHELNETMNIPRTLKEAGLGEKIFLKDFDELIKNSMKGSTVRNPAPINEAEMAQLLKLIYYGQE